MGDNYQFLKTTAKEKDVAVLSSALKLFFRELPQPLISIALSDEIRKAVFNDKGTQEVTDLIESRLTFVELKVLNYLLDHLNRVSQYPTNKMDSKKFGCCFQPKLSPCSIWINSSKKAS